MAPHVFVNFTGLADGTYYLNATANDSYDNRNWTETRVIVLDTHVPVVHLVAPLNNSYSSVNNISHFLLLISNKKSLLHQIQYTHL